jgi:hypothetical protein
MNIFILDNDPRVAAISQCNTHVVKMILETAQMLSTAHRVLDGQLITTPKKHWELPDGRENLLYKAAHTRHPCSLWVMESSKNYAWAYHHLKALSEEFTFRFGKIHKSWDKLGVILESRPSSIKEGDLTPFRLAMNTEPQCINPEDPVGSYRKFYITKQKRFKMTWTGRDKPYWFEGV